MKLYQGALLAGALLLAPLVITSLQAQSTPSTAMPAQTITSRAMTIDTQPVGEVLVGNTVVFRIREAAGGYTPVQRANIVASRLAALVSQGFDWRSVEVGRVNNQTALLMGNQLLITADSAQARGNNTSPRLLAAQWLGNTQTALRGMPVTTVAGTTERFPSWENASTRIVPILSAGTPGVQLGVAQITGPRSRVDDVKAVLEVDLIFQRAARIMTFVPSSEISELRRVQGVAISALLQYEVFNF